MLLPILGVLALLSMPVIAVALSRRDRKNEQEPTASPIDWGAGSVLPSDGIRVEPLFPTHNPENCDRCKHQAPGISAA